MLWRGTQWSIFGRMRGDRRWRLNRIEAAALGTEHGDAPWPCHMSSLDLRFVHARATQPQVFSVIRDQDSVGNSLRSPRAVGVTERWCTTAADMSRSSVVSEVSSKGWKRTWNGQKRVRCDVLTSDVGLPRSKMPSSGGAASGAKARVWPQSLWNLGMGDSIYRAFLSPTCEQGFYLVAPLDSDGGSFWSDSMRIFSWQ
jgi:hypothetical protein